MANWGVATWDANGADNNTGLVRVLVLGTATLIDGQTTGSWSYTVPAGMRIDYLFQNTSTVGTMDRRRFTVNGGTVSISAAGTDFSAGTEPRSAGRVVFYLRAI